ncbi:MAG: hypothetical protein IPN76_11935 [Saprospiraceae bacterium]|nr:hypothetical protein [Saprospiraceae bacterium]
MKKENSFIRFINRICLLLVQSNSKVINFPAVGFDMVLSHVFTSEILFNAVTAPPRFHSIEKQPIYPSAYSSTSSRLILPFNSRSCWQGSSAVTPVLDFGM